MTHGPIQELLQADHARLTELLAGVCSSEGIDLGTYQRFRAGLLRHIGMEEKILLPAVRKLRPGQDVAAAAQLKLDHAALAALLVPTPTLAIIDRLRKVMALHDAIEEGPKGLYALFDGIAGADAAEICTRMTKVPPVSLSPYRDGPKQFEAIERSLQAAGRTK